MNLRRFADLHPEPWRNGGGVTRTVAVGDAPDGAAPAWRVSVASIDADGPFSRFDGYDRTIVSIDGPPARLEIAGVSTSLLPHDPLCFAGESEVYCSIAGPTVDLNVMVRRELAQAKVWVERSDRLSLPATSMDRLVFVLDGQVTVPATASKAGRFDCVQLERGSACMLTGEALLARIEIEDR